MITAPPLALYFARSLPRSTQLLGRDVPCSMPKKLNLMPRCVNFVTDDQC